MDASIVNKKMTESKVI